MEKIINCIIESWADIDGNVNTTEDILEWISEKNKSISVSIQRIALEESNLWFYDENTGVIRNNNNSFFSIVGLQCYRDGDLIIEQPVILQDEIGYLGIICKMIDQKLNFLMQAKIEPGNINKVQISPTIQATKSNFSQKHGGKKPSYLEYFLNARNHHIIVDQIQSEQSSRFYKKRNRNIIILVEDSIEVLPSHKWMTLGQIKQLMTYNNLVNMDTRTVISCIPFCVNSHNEFKRQNFSKHFTDRAFFNSIFEGGGRQYLTEIYHYINNYKMFTPIKHELAPLFSLEGWHMCDRMFQRDDGYSFRVIFCDISIEGREVVHWTQPLFEAIGQATFGLIMCNFKGVKHFLVHAVPEVGCHDQIEIGPSVQLEPNFDYNAVDDEIVNLFLDIRNSSEGIKYNVLLSEEGGRFYCEQNQNIIIEIEQPMIQALPKGYFWVDYLTLNRMIQINNCVNIQLRNLLSLLKL